MSAKDSAYSGPRSYKSSTARSTRVDHTRQHAEHSRRDPKPSESSKRDTDHFLQYYQSPLADGRVNETDRESSSTRRAARQNSGASTSSSDYSDENTEFSTTAPLSISKVTRRSKIPSDGGSDRRRLAIVQMDPLEDLPPKKYKRDNQSQRTSIRTRRVVASDLAGIALVAPPDAAPSSYTHLTPPTTTPTTPDLTAQNTAREQKHRKVASDVTTRNSDRESGAADQRGQTTSESHIELRINIDNALTLPGNQQCKPSRSPSPGGVSDASNQTHELLSPAQTRPDMMRGNTQNSLITTPEIGERKDVGVRVAAPVVIDLESAGPIKRKDATSQNDAIVHLASAVPFSSQAKSGCLHYEPGVHSTAGPLPPLPPPRAMFNIDVNSPAPPRPPRHNSPVPSGTRGDIEAVKKALQLPPSVTAVLASRTPKPNIQEPLQSPEGKAAPLADSQPEVTSTNTSELHKVKSVHRREGAFEPSLSTSTTTRSISDIPASQTSMTSEDNHPHGDAKVLDDTKSSNDHTSGDDTVPPITVIQPMQLIEEQDVQEEQDVSTDLITSSTPRRPTSNDSSARRSQSPSYKGRAGETPSPPPKSFRNSLTTNLKRLSSSLPRTPSLSSKSRRSSGAQYSSRTPSPPMQSIPLPPPRPKIISSSPPAMFCAEISAKKTSLERCMLYAQKINELYLYDSGLSDWTIEAKQRANNNRPTVAFSSHTFTPQPRHTSRSSIFSEFPRRPDASMATDLTVKSTDLAPAAPPVLPYPSLANNMYPARSSSMANTPPGSIRSLTSSSSGTKSSGGFFASLGRKNSISSSKKSGLPQIATNQPARVLTKPPPTSPAPRIINIPTSPVVPGGPRAIPNRRSARSQTLMATTNSFASNASGPERSEALGRRPSLFELTPSPEPAIIDIAPDPEFVRQVDKLAHLLPDADRAVLAGYLRRAGQDILAIGQYLEDEKNGTIKPP